MGDKKIEDEALQRMADLVAKQIVSQFQTAIESIEEIKQQVARIPAIQDDVNDLKHDMRAVKQAIKETNQDLRELEQRVNRLEAAYST